jgi:hypothetical protein
LPARELLHSTGHLSISVVALGSQIGEDDGVVWRFRGFGDHLNIVLDFEAMNG